MSDRAVPARFLRFADFVFDRKSGRLYRGETQLPLPEQAVQVLEALLDANGEPVARSDLRERLWPGAVAGDFDNKLNAVIRKLRIALKDDARAPRLVETLPRRGYRVCVPVVPGAGSRPRLVRRNRAALVAGGVLLAAAVALAVMQRFESGRTPQPPRLVVLPFDDLSVDGGGRPAAHGLAAGITARLASIDPSTLVILGPETGLRMKDTGSGLDLAEPDYALSGSLQRGQASLRLSLALRRNASGEILWSETLERPLEEGFALEWEVADRVAGRIGAVAFRPRKHRARVPAEALDAYWQGRLQWAEGDPVLLPRSVEAFDRALTIAPDFAEALAAKADAYNSMAMQGVMHSPEGYKRALAAAEAALALDHGLASAHAARGLALYLGAWKWSEAGEALETAAALEPASANVHAYLAGLRAVTGDLEAAISASRRAITLNPLAATVHADLAWYFYYGGQYEEAVHQALRARTLNREGAGILLAEVLARFGAGQDAEAVPSLLDLVRLRDGTDTRTTVDSLVAARGARHAWRWWLARRLEQPVTSGRYLAAIGTTSLGDTVRALALLRGAASDRLSWVPFIAVDPGFAHIRPTGGFRELLRQLGLL